MFLANMVLLAHVFIPHHHLFSEPCSISYHQSDATHHCRHLDSKANFSENDRNAHRELGLKDCLLDNIYIRFVNDSHTLHSGGDDVEGDSPFSVLYLPADYSNRIEPESTPLPFLRKPHLISLYTSHIAQSKGLRAPPSC